MKLTEVAQHKKLGSYAGARYSSKSNSDIQQYIQKANIPNGVEPDSLHTTILYSTKHLPEFEPKGKYDPTIKATPIDIDVWPSQPDDNGHVNNCLVLKLSAPDLVARHESLMDEHNATYSFDEYIPHVTLSYDIGDMDHKTLPKFTKQLEIVEEYGEELNTDWVNTK